MFEIFAVQSIDERLPFIVRSHASANEVSVIVNQGSRLVASTSRILLQQPLKQSTIGVISLRVGTLHLITDQRYVAGQQKNVHKSRTILAAGNSSYQSYDKISTSKNTVTHDSFTRTFRASVQTRTEIHNALYKITRVYKSDKIIVVYDIQESTILHQRIKEGMCDI